TTGRRMPSCHRCQGRLRRPTAAEESQTAGGAHAPLDAEPAYPRRAAGLRENRLSCSPGMVCVFGDECLLVAGEGGTDRLDEGGQGGVAALGQVMVLDRAKDWLDGVEVRRVGRQEGEKDASRPERGGGRTGVLAAVYRAIIEHDDCGDGGGRDTATTGAPAAAKAMAIPRPRPRLAPTTTVLLPARSL